MEVNYEDIVSSPTFKFLVGSEKKPMFLHNVLVAQHSKTLDTLMNGAMTEAQQGCALLDDVEPDIFALFSQWLYTGSYGSAAAEVTISPAGAPLPLPPRNVNLFGSQSISPTPESVSRPVFGSSHATSAFGTSRSAFDTSYSAFGTSNTPLSFGYLRNEQSSYAADASKKQSLWASFTGKSSAELPKASAVASALELRADCYKHLYQAHAQVYCFADKYGIPALQQASVDKLKHNLVDVTKLTAGHIQALVNLIDYTHGHTVSSGGQARNFDKLRWMVTQYAAIMFELLFKNDSFKELLMNNGDLAVDLMSCLLNRLD